MKFGRVEMNCVNIGFFCIVCCGVALKEPAPKRLTPMGLIPEGGIKMGITNSNKVINVDRIDCDGSL